MCITCEPFCVDYILCRISHYRQTEQTDRQSLRQTSSAIHPASTNVPSVHQNANASCTYVTCIIHGCASLHMPCCPGPACTARNTNREAYFTPRSSSDIFQWLHALARLLSGLQCFTECCRVALIGNNASHGLTQSHQLGLRLATCLCKMPLSVGLYVQRHHS